MEPETSLTNQAGICRNYFQILNFHIQPHNISKMSLPSGRTIDALLWDLESLKEVPALSKLVTEYLSGDYRTILQNPTSQTLFSNLTSTISLPKNQQGAIFQSDEFTTEQGLLQACITGLAAFNAFLQSNVTGPPLDWGNVIPKENGFRGQCLRSLDLDGVSVYQHIPYVELFCLARLVFTVYFPRFIRGEVRDCRWMRVRINAYHQRLLSGVSAGRLTDSTMLQDVIEADLRELEEEVLGKESTFSTEAKVMFLLEKAQVYILQGLDMKAKENVREAKRVSGFAYELSGALGKRTKFQQKDISQLVVFARSREDDAAPTEPKEEQVDAPEALDLNDDTLHENIQFAKSDKMDYSALPAELKDMQPDSQPQLKPLDQITLLTEATLKDVLSPLDKLNSEEILPYAVRVLNDKPTNWQIYTQALLVRSRIEAHRSRTQERSVLQLQVIVDQIVADTQEEASPENKDSEGIPEIKISSFLPRAKANESAPAQDRLRFIFPLASPTRWEVETELAFAWSGAGSFISALEIFKRLKLWAEVALCFHNVGREDKARQIVRRQLFYSSKGEEMDKYDVDAEEIAGEKWNGEMRGLVAHAPRLWCILGDLDNDPTCWERAWEISKHRYARAKRTLGEYYIKSGELENAREAYMAASIVNRQNGDTWSRLGDIDLKVGNWDGAVIAFQQAIMLDDTDAKTYSNLGSALLSKHGELVMLQKAATQMKKTEQEEDEEIDFALAEEQKRQDPKEILKQALRAYKKGASLAHTNWQIWDNVLTIALRIVPPSFPDLLLAVRNIIRIRGPSLGEAATDIEVLRALVQEVVMGEKRENHNPEESPEKNGGIYTPPRGSLARAAIQLFAEDIEPLITTRAELWELAEKLALYKKDYVNALLCAERAWRIVIADEAWETDGGKWKEVVESTVRLVDGLESYGPLEQGGKEVEKGWKMKARSAVRGVMGRARDAWEGSEGWETLEARLVELKN